MHADDSQTPPDQPASEMSVPMSDQLLEDWLAGHDHRPVRRGEIVKGEIVHVGDEGLLVDVGAKSEGFVPSNDLDRLDEEMVADLQEGSEVLVYCVTPEDRDGNILLSISQAQVARDWERARALYDAGEVLQTTVAGHNKGGVIVYLGQARGFVPASQLARRRRAQFQSSDDARPWADLVGEVVWLKIIECDAQENRLILSEQAARRQRRKGLRDQLLSELSVGDVVTGEVTSLAEFGAFVDLGGADGLVHISELAWERVRHPGDVVSLGEEVEVQVISIDEDRKRIGLSMKRLEPEPWDFVEDRFQIGDLVQGTVTKVADFGAFARIDGGLEGLIHISELTDRVIDHPGQVVSSGDQVTVRIIRIEPARRRIGLSMRRVEIEDAVEADEVGTEAEVVEPVDEPVTPADLVGDAPPVAEMEVQAVEVAAGEE
jgi:small subunit ribosomal protein S1